ncbi:MAG: hypothetical protein EP332_06475 [Bacteroidetes bacterium]|nr:MAG: hypothetical protein EP332_06475 [Bacteroidota bacterium]
MNRAYIYSTPMDAINLLHTSFATSSSYFLNGVRPDSRFFHCSLENPNFLIISNLAADTCFAGIE